MGYLPSRTTAALRSHFPDAVVVPGDDGYETRRQLWNGSVDTRPAAIVECTGNDDVKRCIDVAQREDVPLVVRGSGHHASGLASVDGGIVVDLSCARNVEVDAGSRMVSAQPGVLAHELHAKTQQFGMLVPTGMEPDVGISGLTLGGGEGWFTSAFGLTCDNLIAADVVTAAGEVVRASEDENPDLLWGLRGGGGNLGVVTSFRYRLNEIGKVTAGTVIYPADRADEIVRRWRDQIVDAPDELGSMLHYVRTPRPLIVLGLCYAGVGDAAEKTLRAYLELGTPLANSVRTMDVLDLPKVFGSKGTESGYGNYWTSRYTDEVSDAAIDTYVDRGVQIGSQVTAVILTRYGGAFGRIESTETAYPHRDTPFQFSTSTRWSLDEDSADHVRWSRETWEAFAPFSSGGVYANWTSDDTVGSPELAYRHNLERLQQLKSVYDPSSFFRGGLNAQDLS